MAKKLVSFLGTGDYQETTYVMQDVGEFRSCFVQVALADLLGRQGALDEVVVLLTAKARERNWAPVGKLRDMAARHAPVPFHDADIPEGRDSDEIWRIFEIMAGLLGQGDEVILDLTHSLRSIPVIGLACLQYLRVLKGVKLAGLWYGAFEAPDAEGRRPLFDLLPFVELMNWSWAVNELERFGSSGELCRLIREHAMPLCEASRGADDDSKRLRNLANVLEDASKSLGACRGRSLLAVDEKSVPYYESIHELVQGIASAPGSLPPLRPLLELIDHKYSQLDGKGGSRPEVRRGLAAVQWCLKHGLLQQACTLLQETCVTWVCLRNTLDWSKREDRELVSAILGVEARGVSRGEWNEHLKKRLGTGQKVADSIPAAFLPLYKKLMQIRNDFNHGGFHEPMKAKNIELGIKQSFDALGPMISSTPPD